MCYITLRGLVYFGGSIHVYHGVQMLVNMYYDLFSTSASKEVTVSQVDIVFNCCFLTLGILIFRGVEQESKTFIKWPTIGFTLLLAFRFIVEIVKQVERERSGVGGPVRMKPPNNTISPFSYSSMSIDVDPLISAAVGIYIFILFVYNHSLEYQHLQEEEEEEQNRSARNNRNNSNANHNPAEIPSSCGASDASSDTVLLINATPHVHTRTAGDSNNNTNNNNTIGLGRFGGNSDIIINTRSNPLFELDGVRVDGMRRFPGQHLPNLLLFPNPTRAQHHHNDDAGSMSPDTPPEYKVDAV